MIQRRPILVTLLAMALSACDRTYIEGRVTDVRGEALPGVNVQIPGAGQDLTNGLGRYRIVAVPGSAARVEFAKTGYASGELPVGTVTKRVTVVPDVALWPLPLNPGVYVVNDLKFAEATWVVPRQFYLKDGTSTFATELPEEIRESDGDPFIVVYRTPRYNARLSRLIEAEAMQGGAKSVAVQVWIESPTMSVTLEPLDTPEGQLLRVQIGRPLDPGVYGVHWGAMEGYTTLDTRVFLFRVPEPPIEVQPEPSEEATAPEGEALPAEEDEQKAEKTAVEVEPATEPKAATKTPVPDNPKPKQPELLEPTDESPTPPPQP